MFAWKKVLPVAISPAPMKSHEDRGTVRRNGKKMKKTLCCLETAGSHFDSVDFPLVTLTSLLWKINI